MLRALVEAGGRGQRGRALCPQRSRGAEQRAESRKDRSGGESCLFQEKERRGRGGAEA